MRDKGNKSKSYEYRRVCFDQCPPPSLTFSKNLIQIECSATGGACRKKKKKNTNLMLIFCMSMIATFGCSQRTRGGWKKIRCWGGTSSLGASVLLVNSALEPESETCLFCKQRNDPVTGLTFLWRWTMKFTEASSSRGQPKKHTFLNVFIVSYHRAAVQPNFQRWGRCQLPSSIITAPAR